MDPDPRSQRRGQSDAAGASPAPGSGAERGAAAGGAEHGDPSSDTGQFCGLAALPSGSSRGLRGAGSWLWGRAEQVLQSSVWKLASSNNLSVGKFWNDAMGRGGTGLTPARPLHRCIPRWCIGKISSDVISKHGFGQDPHASKVRGLTMEGTLGRALPVPGSPAPRADVQAIHYAVMGGMQQKWQ